MYKWFNFKYLINKVLRFCYLSDKLKLNDEANFIYLLFKKKVIVKFLAFLFFYISMTLKKEKV